MNALLLAHSLQPHRSPLPPRAAHQIPRHEVEQARHPSPSQVARAPMPPRLTGTLHGASVPAPRGLPGVIVRVGPAGGDAALAHLRAGHSADDLVEAAANSLARAAMISGRLDPARYAEWVQHRLHFLAHVSNAAELFGDIEAAGRTIRAVTAGNHRPQLDQAQPHHAPFAMPSR